MEPNSIYSNSTLYWLLPLKDFYKSHKEQCNSFVHVIEKSFDRVAHGLGLSSSDINILTRSKEKKTSKSPSQNC